MHDDTEEILHPNRGARPIAVVSNRGPSSTRQLEGGGQQAIKFGAPAAERRSDCSGRIDAREARIARVPPSAQASAIPARSR